jgi:ligand-binding sensor domain-containing protein/signal transduction histidine kinase/CheY-like chemotaxis protein/AraC-like DNA-binding protein
LDRNLTRMNNSINAIKRGLPIIKIGQKWAILWVICFFIGTKSTAQSFPPKFRPLAQEQGLSNNAVTFIYQDKFGFMWIATRYGLNRYDGYEIQVYSKESKGRFYIPLDNIYNICEDALGRLLIIPFNGEVMVLNVVTQAFEPYFTADEKQRNGLNNLVMLDLYSDKAGILWLSTLNGGLVAFDQTKRTVRVYTTESQPAILGNNVNSVFNDHQNRLWIATDIGLTVLSADRNSVTNYPLSKISADNEFNTINTLYQDRLNRMWVGTARGLFLFDAATAEFVAFSSVTKQQIPPTIIRCLQEDADGNMWIGTDDGLHIFDAKKQEIRTVAANSKDRFALNDKYVFSIFRDRQNNMWAGTYYGGVNIHYFSTYGFGGFPQEAAHAALEGKIIRDIVEDATGNLWFGLENSGIVGLMGKDRQVQRLADKNLQTAQVQGLDCDAEGNLWIGNYNKGLDFFDVKTNQTTHFAHNPSDPSSLSLNAVNNVLVDKRGRIWAGTNLGGLNRYDKAQNVFYHYKHSEQAGSLSNDQVATLHEDQQGRIWVGTVRGLNLYDEQKNAFITYPLLRGGKKSAASYYYITAILDNANGSIWVGTGGDGLFLLDPNTGKSEQIGADAPVSNATVYKILKDKSEQLWFSSNNGLYRLNPDDNHYEKYTLSDGLISNQFNYNSGLLLSDGRLIFGAVNGYTLFDPTQIQKSNYKPSIIISDFRVGDAPAYSVTELKDNPFQKIRLAHDQSTLHFSFVALEYGNYDNKLYAYKLEGYDKEWSTPSKNRSATYTQLPFGTYHFLVKSTNNDGEWLATAMPIDIEIRPPFWRTYWAYAFYMLLLGGGIYALRRYLIVRNNRKRRALLAHYERQREHELSDMKYRFFTNISHEFRTPLTLIKAPMDELKTRLLELSREQLGQRLQLMGQQVDKMMRLVDQLMDVSKSETGQLQVYLTTIDSVALGRQVVQQFHTMAAQQKIELTYTPSVSHLFSQIDGDKIEKVIYNLLSNAFKYTPSDGQIAVRLIDERAENGELSYILIQVEDNGIGIPDADIPRIFDRFYQGNNQQTLAQKGTGIGLAHCRELVELHQGTITVKKAAHKGSIFEVHLPFVSPPIELKETNNELPEEDLLPIGTPQYFDEKTDIRTQKPAVLVVEDDPDVQNYLRELLEEKYRVTCMDNGQVAWAYLQKELPDVVVSDVMMPLMDGIHFCKHIKTHLTTCHLPVVLLTAKTTVDDQIEGLETGADDYVSKPFNPNVLLARIQNLLMSRRILKDKMRKELLLQPAEVTTNSLDEAFLKTVVTTLEANIGNPDFSAQTLVQALNMSRSAFYRKLQALTDLSPSDFIREIRMKRAAQLLENQELNVTQVAYAVGYNDLKTFRQNFQAQFGTTPSKYIKKK